MPPNEYFNASGYPATRAAGESAPLRQSLANIALGFDKLPPLAGRAGHYVRVNSAGTGLETVANPFTAADVLAMLLTVDGAGSGLDADRLRGLGLTASGARWNTLPYVGGDGVTEIGRYLDFHNTAGSTADYTSRLYCEADGSLFLNGNRLWHAGNDGQGSGLDADLFDGTDSSNFMAYRGSVAGIAVNGAVANGWYHVQQSGYADSMLVFNTPGSSTGTVQIFTGFMGGLLWRNRVDNVNWTDWRTIWHSANDGAGSGLDADLLDGFQPDHYANGNTIALRHAAGYLYASYFNQSSGNNEEPTISQLMVTNGADGFMRKASLQHLRNQLGFSLSSGATGFQVLPGGLILQWGSAWVGDVPSNEGATGVIGFPLAFPNACLRVFFGIEDASGSVALAVVTAAKDRFSATFRVQEWAQLVQGAAVTMFAIGF